MRLSIRKVLLISFLLATLALQQCRCDEFEYEDEVELTDEEWSDEEVEEEPDDGSPQPMDLDEGETEVETEVETEIEVEEDEEAEGEATPEAETEEEEVPSGAQPPHVISSADLQVIELTSSTFSKVAGDNDVWLIEFSANWCSHCQAFASTYSEMARHYHSQPELKVKVAKVNIDQQRALAMRFGVKLFPSFYLIDGWSAYKFEGHRSKKNLMDFVAGGYKKQAALSFYTSPLGPLGLAQGVLVSGGMKLSNLFYWLQDSLGMSSLVAGTVMFGSFFLSVFVGIVFCAIAFTPKAKVD